MSDVNLASVSLEDSQAGASSKASPGNLRSPLSDPLQMSMGLGTESTGSPSDDPVQMKSDGSQKSAKTEAGATLTEYQAVSLSVAGPIGTQPFLKWTGTVSGQLDFGHQQQKGAKDTSSTAVSASLAVGIKLDLGFLELSAAVTGSIKGTVKGSLNPAEAIRRIAEEAINWHISQRYAERGAKIAELSRALRSGRTEILSAYDQLAGTIADGPEKFAEAGEDTILRELFSGASPGDRVEDAADEIRAAVSDCFDYFGADKQGDQAAALFLDDTAMVAEFTRLSKLRIDTPKQAKAAAAAIYASKAQWRGGYDANIAMVQEALNRVQVVNDPDVTVLASIGFTLGGSAKLNPVSGANIAYTYSSEKVYSDDDPNKDGSFSTKSVTKGKHQIAFSVGGMTITASMSDDDQGGHALDANIKGEVSGKMKQSGPEVEDVRPGMDELRDIFKATQGLRGGAAAVIKGFGAQIKNRGLAEKMKRDVTSTDPVKSSTFTFEFTLGGGYTWKDDGSSSGYVDFAWGKLIDKGGSAGGLDAKVTAKQGFKLRVPI